LYTIMRRLHANETILFPASSARSRRLFDAPQPPVFTFRVAKKFLRELQGRGIDALLQRSQRVQSRIGLAKPDCPLHQGREAWSPSAIHRVRHSGSWPIPPDACVATIKLYPSRAESSVIGSRDYRHVG
jgi:hypothetical protein